MPPSPLAGIRPHRFLSVIAATLLLSGCAGSQSFMHPAGDSARTVMTLAWVLFAGAAAIFTLVMALAWQGARRDGRAIDARRWVIVGGFLFPLVVLTVLLGFSTWHSRQLTQAPSGDALVVGVTGKQWWWEVRYADPHGGTTVVLANELRIPVNREVYLGLETSDVIHSFWVPALGGKIDMVPGRVNHLRLRADKTGTYRGQCAEFCGSQHALMALHVVVQPPEEFAAWLAQQARPAAEPSSAMLHSGRQAFFDHNCASCHAIRGTRAAGHLGPDLTHVASRLYLGAGTLRNHRQALSHWIADTQSLKPGARMPSFGHIDDETLAAMAAYLDTLR